MNLPIGGIANAIKELLPILESIKSLKISLLTKYSEYKPTSQKTELHSFYKFRISKINTIYFFLKTFFKTIKINKRNTIHAIYVPTYYIDSLPLFLINVIFKIPLIIKIPIDFETLRNEMIIYNSSSLFLKISYYGWMNFFKKFYIGKKKIFYQAINNRIYLDLLDLGINKSKILKLPNAISYRKYFDIKRRHKDNTHFGFIGRLVKRKNIKFLLGVFEKYISKFPKDKLFIYGIGPEQNLIEAIIKERNLNENIKIQGFEKDKRKMYSNIDVLIHPSFGEGCPNTILESSVTNTFIIASSVIGIREIVSHEKVGLLFNPFNENDLLKQLIFYKQHQDLIPNILKYARSNVIKNYNVNLIGNQIYNFIKSKWINKKQKEPLKISILSLVFPHPKAGIMPGVESYVESFAVPLKKLGYDIRIITTYWNGSNKFDNYKGIPIMRILDSKSLFGKLGSIFHLNNFTFGLNLLLKKNFKLYQNSDVLIIPLAIGFTRFFKLKKIPIISCFLHYDRSPSLVNQFNLPIYHYLEKKQFTKHKNILTISNHSKKDLMKFYGIGKKDINVFPVGIDTEKFNPSKFSLDIRKKYGDNILLCVGPFLKRKRISVLLEAMTQIIKVIPDTHLILIGEGLLLRKLIKLSNSLGIQNSTSFLKFVETEKLLRFYASCDIFIHPSEFEGFGQVLLEAMASGTPCICANREPMSEIIGDAGKTFKVNDPMDLSEKIIDLLKDREKLADLRKNIGDILKKYDSNNIAKDWSIYIEKTIKNYHSK